MNKGFTVQVDKNANYLGEEDKGRTPGKIDGGTVQPGTERPLAGAEIKGGKRKKWGKITYQCLIFHIRQKG